MISMNSASVKITVMVPVYNIARFLPRCLDSLSSQTMRELEILMIDDGSTDECAEICADYAARDRRFRLIRKAHENLSSARNLALDEAKGEYLMFVDGDDWVDPAFCEAPFRVAQENAAELVLFRYQRVNERGACIRISDPVPDGPVSRNTALEMIITASGSFMWNKLWKRSLFEGIRFPDVTVCSDVCTSFSSVLKAERIISLDRALYFYRKRRGSNVTLRTDKAMADYYAMHMERYHALHSLGFNPELLEKRRIAVCLTYATRRKEDPSDPASISSYRTLRELPGIPQDMRLKHRLALFLLRRCKPLFDLSSWLLGLRRK